MQLEESAKQDLSSMDIEIQTLEKGEAVVSTLNIPFPVPARIHRYEDYLRRLEKEEKRGEPYHQRRLQAVSGIGERST